jgi:hypothetical protein
MHGALNARIKIKQAEAAMRLPILRASILGLVLAASPASLSGSAFSPKSDYIVLALSDVIACNYPSNLPDDVTAAYSQVNDVSGARLWLADIYDLTDCLRQKAEAI